MKVLPNSSRLLPGLLLLTLPALAHAQPHLGTGELRIAGLQLAASPASQTVPRNQATGLAVQLEDPAEPGEAMAAVPAALLGTFVVKGDLSGPGLAEPLELSVGFDASPAAILPIPPLLRVGNYVLDNLRLESTSGEFLLPAEPAVAALSVIDRVIVTSVSSRPLSLEEIQERGIVIDESNFTAYEFTFGVATESGQVPIKLDVAFPQDPEATGGEGGFSLPAVLPALDVPNLEVQPLILESPLDLDEAVSLPPIPAVIVIPGNIAFLHQFFQVIVLVSNVAPAGSRLVVTAAEAELELPVGNDLVPETADDPLAAADFPGAPVPVDGVLAAPIRNTSDGVPAFGPGADANAEFVVEGRKEGTHRLHVTIHAELQGLPIGPVPLRGTAAGTVLVRNPRFALTFNHPEVVRAGETYSLLVTIHNTGEADANLVTLRLDPSDVSGATITGDSDPASPLGTVVVPTIRRSDAATVAYQLIARKNGQVTATGFASGDPLSATFTLRTGIGDRGIPLSPETLVLPSYASDLPGDFFFQAMRVLGLAHSVATAPAGAPIGISTRISRSRVEERALELAEAGLRIRIGEAPVTSIGDVMLDWLSNCRLRNADCGIDLGFDEILRTTGAGHDLEAAWAAEIQSAVGGGQSAVSYQAAFATAERYRPHFVSVAVAGSATLVITDAQGRRTRGCAGMACPPPETLERNVAGTALLGLGGGELAVIGVAAESSNIGTSSRGRRGTSTWSCGAAAPARPRTRT
jgi:hypothetical protein